jgi:hypothetical protein
MTSFLAVHVSRVPECLDQLDFADAPSGRHPMARHVLSTGHLAGRKRAVTVAATIISLRQCPATEAAQACDF